MQTYVILVDLVKSFPTHIYLQKLASIQPRTRPWQILQDEPRKTSRWLERGRYPKTSHVKQVVGWVTKFRPNVARSRLYRHRSSQAQLLGRFGGEKSNSVFFAWIWSIWEKIISVFRVDLGKVNFGFSRGWSIWEKMILTLGVDLVDLGKINIAAICRSLTKIF